MKQIGLYILLICLLLACQKEDGITPGIGFENLYTIQDDPNDSIQHKRYELYTTYGVPVFFNDTIGKVFVKVDVNGDSVFRYETLDLNWTFSGSNSGSVTRLTDPDLMMKSLRFAEIFLKNSQPALYPYALWLTEKCYQLSSAGVEQKEIISRYRNLMFSWIDQMKEEEMQEKAIGFRNEVVKLKVQNYSDELNAFNNMLDESLYDKNWWKFYPDERIPYWRNSASLQVWYPWPLEEEWEQDSSYRKEMMTYGNFTNTNWPEGIWTNEEVDNYALYCRELVGALGFVSYDPEMGIRRTPRNTDIDLELYLIEMMKYNRKQFLERWEGSPLVIKRYEILYSIIRDELGVEL